MEMPPIRTICTCMAVLTLAAYCAQTYAAPVAPGQTIDIGFDSLVEPTGTLVTEATKTFPIVFTAPTGFELFDPASGVFQGTLHSRVFRDPATSHLTFDYDFSVLTGNPAGEHTKVSIGSFSGFSTDVTGQIHVASVGVTRAGDGS